MRWDTIENAPKDGTRILLKTKLGGIGIGYWSETAYFGGNENDRPGWQIFDCEMDPYYSVAIEHAEVWLWQTLPE